MPSNKEAMIKKLGSVAAYKAYMGSISKGRANVKGGFRNNPELARRAGKISKIKKETK
jgi:hypothetical protein